MDHPKKKIRRNRHQYYPCQLAGMRVGRCLYDALEREAARLGIPPVEIIREVLSIRLGVPARDEPTPSANETLAARKVMGEWERRIADAAEAEEDEEERGRIAYEAEDEARDESAMSKTKE